jgi:hypothetical protein
MKTPPWVHVTVPPTKLEEAIGKGTKVGLASISHLACCVTVTAMEFEDAVNSGAEIALGDILRVVWSLKGEPFDAEDIVAIRKITKSNIRAALVALMARGD